jgi:hypothetical protein
MDPQDDVGDLIARIWLVFIKGKEDKKSMLFNFHNGEILQLPIYIGIKRDTLKTWGEGNARSFIVQKLNVLLDFFYD